MCAPVCRDWVCRQPGSPFESFTLSGATFLLLEGVAIGICAALGARLGAVANQPRVFQWLNRVSGSMMIGFGVTLALLRRPTT